MGILKELRLKNFVSASLLFFILSHLPSVYAQQIQFITYNIANTSIVPYHEQRYAYFIKNLDGLLGTLNASNAEALSKGRSQDYYYYALFLQEAFLKTNELKRLAKKHGHFMTQMPVDFGFSLSQGRRYRPGTVILTNMIPYKETIAEGYNLKKRASADGKIRETFIPWVRDQLGPSEDLARLNHRGILHLRFFFEPIGVNAYGFKRAGYYLDLFDFHMTYTPTPQTREIGTTEIHHLQLKQLAALVKNARSPAVMGGDFNLGDVVRWVYESNATEPEIVRAGLNPGASAFWPAQRVTYVTTHNLQKRWDGFKQELRAGGFQHVPTPTDRVSFSFDNPIVSTPAEGIQLAGLMELEVPQVGSFDNFFIQPNVKACKSPRECIRVKKLNVPNRSKLVFTRTYPVRRQDGLAVRNAHGERLMIPTSDHYGLQTERVDLP